MSSEQRPMGCVPKRILIVQLRRLGDVLLTTPLVRAINSSIPTAEVSVLVYRSTVQVVEGLPGIHEVIALSDRPRVFDQLSLLCRLFQKYDWALCPMTTDRSLVLSRFAGRKAFSFHRRGWSWLFTATTPFDNFSTHTVIQNLMLANLVGIPPVAEVMTPAVSTRKIPASLGLRARYIVIHPYPKFSYKMWPLAKWQNLVDCLVGLGFEVVVTGGAYPVEILHNNKLFGVRNFTGLLSWKELSGVLASASAFVGPDTAPTHLSAALGTPTIALFGPSNPSKWGPWPRFFNPSEGGRGTSFFQSGQSPWDKRGSRRIGNVFLVQGDGACVPCGEEGCERHIMSNSSCLTELGVDRVFEAVRTMVS